MDLLKHYVFEDIDKWNNEHTKYTEKIAAQVADMTDKTIINSIIDFAKREGITDLYLLDSEFVKTALINEAKRRKGGEG